MSIIKGNVSEHTQQVHLDGMKVCTPIQDSSYLVQVNLEIKFSIK